MNELPNTPLQFFGFTASLLLAIWYISIGLHWFAYFIGRIAISYGPLAMSWANEICSGDAEERAIVLGLMNAAAYAVQSWLPLLTYPQLDSPRFRRGFVYSTVVFGVQFGVTGLVAWLQVKERAQEEEVMEVDAGSGGGEILGDDETTWLLSAS